VLGLVRWARSNAASLTPYLLTVLVFPLPYYVTHASMDYRQPIETVIVVLIVAGFALRPRREAAEERSLSYVVEDVEAGSLTAV
jgi:hypothetical protein